MISLWKNDQALLADAEALINAHFKETPKANVDKRTAKNRGARTSDTLHPSTLAVKNFFIFPESEPLFKFEDDI